MFTKRQIRTVKAVIHNSQKLLTNNPNVHTTEELFKLWHIPTTEYYTARRMHELFLHQHGWISQTQCGVTEAKNQKRWNLIGFHLSKGLYGD